MNTGVQCESVYNVGFREVASYCIGQIMAEQTSYGNNWVTWMQVHMDPNSTAQNTNIFGHYTYTQCLRRPCNVIYSYNKSQRDAPFLIFILVKNSMFRRHLLSIIRSLNIVYTAVGICHTCVQTVC